MAISLDAISLPDDLVWKDRFNHTGVVQTRARTITGGMVIQEQASTAGRPITLSGDQNFGWTDRQTIDALQLLAALPDSPMTLNIHGDAHQVMFRRDNGESSPIVSTPLFEVTDPGVDHRYAITLNLITV